MANTVGNGARLQSGIPHAVRRDSPDGAAGLHLRGVVMATYVTDDPLHPNFLNALDRPMAVYCDVVVYPSIPRQRWFFLEKVLVTQERGGLHDDDLWKPRATTMNVVTQILDNVINCNPGQLDGDHVLIGFLNNSFDEPIILRGLPHPSRDIGNDLYPVGKRLKLKLIDGNPNFRKHNGVFSGVDSSGNHVVDSTFGNQGVLLPGGVEPPPDVLGLSGNQTRNLPKDAKHEIVLYDMSVPLVPVEVARVQCTKDAFEVIQTFLPMLKVEGKLLTAKLTLGSGAVSATVAEHLEILYGLLETWDKTHTHQESTGGQTLVPTQAAAFPAWVAAIKSGKLTFPDG